jgi:WD40 repeat protein
MDGQAGTVVLPDLTPVAAEAGAAEGDPRPIYTWEGPLKARPVTVRSYTPSDGGAARLVAGLGAGATLCVWDTGTGAFLRAMQAPPGFESICSLVTYQWSSEGRPGIAAGSDGGRLCVWDGDDFHLLHAIHTNAEGHYVRCLAVYEEPTSGSTRLVSA